MDDLKLRAQKALDRAASKVKQVSIMPKHFDDDELRDLAAWMLHYFHANKVQHANGNVGFMGPVKALTDLGVPKTPHKRVSSLSREIVMQLEDAGLVERGASRSPWVFLPDDSNTVEAEVISTELARIEDVKAAPLLGERLRVVGLQINGRGVRVEALGEDGRVLELTTA